jgi:(S)-sulfolactate dehydrogenase
MSNTEHPTIVISEFMDENAVESLRARYTVHYHPDLVDRPQQLQELLAHARALIVRNRTQVDARLLGSAPKLEALGRLGVGLDNIDLETCRERGIAVYPATGANARAVAEYVVASALLALRGAYGSSTEVASGQWPRTVLSTGREAGGRTLGLVGFGDIGQLTARLARGLDLRVVAHDPAFPDDAPLWSEQGVKPLDLTALLAQSDIVSLHLPLTAATRGLFGRENLARMKPGAVLINTARGGIVDETALAVALRSGHLGSAVIDVFEQEPLPAGSPLAGLPNVWLTPHIAGLTSEANVRVSALVAERIAGALNRRKRPA